MICESYGSPKDLASLAVSILALMFSVLAFRNSQLSRRNQLFDRRYEFYRRLAKAFLETGPQPELGGVPDRPQPDFLDVFPLSREAGFLFGEDIAKLVLSLAERECSESAVITGVPDEWFQKPFERYLKLR